jgi:hypothetical protein
VAPEGEGRRLISRFTSTINGACGRRFSWAALRETPLPLGDKRQRLARIATYAPAHLLQQFLHRGTGTQWPGTGRRGHAAVVPFHMQETFS